MKTKKILPNLYLIIILLFVYIPIFSLIIFSFNSSKSLLVFEGFSLEWYQRLFTNDRFLNAVITSLTVASISTVVSTIIGTLAALYLTKQKTKIKDITLGINNIPIVSPEIITAAALLIFFGSFAIQRGMLTMILAHIAFSIPYVVITVYPKAKNLDPDIISASYDLGATPWQTLRKIILPQLRPVVFAGAAIAFAMSFDDFIISYFAASGSPVQNISIYLYSLKRGLDPTANALSTIIIAIIGIKVIFDYTKTKKMREVK